MKNSFLSVLLLAVMLPAFSFAEELPSKYVELLPFVQQAPDQGETGTCLYVASTGAMELLLNKRDKIKNPVAGGKFDLSESYVIQAAVHPSSKDKSFFEVPFLKFNKGHAIHITDWPFTAWDDTTANTTVWENRDWSEFKQIQVPKVETEKLFLIGGRWSTNVLKEAHIKQIKTALVKHRSPVLVNYNEKEYWHVVLIVGYDDKLPGKCYEISDADCGDKKGSFFVRDSFGMNIEVRDYNWFRIRGNAGFVVKEVK